MENQAILTPATRRLGNVDPKQCRGKDMNDNERFIHLATRTSHKRLESMVLYALHYSLRDVLIHSQHAVVVDGRDSPYYVDAYFPDLNLAVEIDEPHHVRQREADSVREQEIQKKIGCRFIRIGCDESIYDQVDRIVAHVRALAKEHGIKPWRHQPKPSYLKTGEYKAHHIKQLEENGIPELMENFENDLFVEGNIYARHTGNVYVRVLNWDEGASKKAIESLNKRQKGRYYALPDNQNGYRGTVEAKEKFYEFIALTVQ
jgi:very-short-patch-repair endonuclease